MGYKFTKKIPPSAGKIFLVVQKITYENISGHLDLVGRSSLSDRTCPEIFAPLSLVGFPELNLGNTQTRVLKPFSSALACLNLMILNIKNGKAKILDMILMTMTNRNLVTLNSTNPKKRNLTKVGIDI